MVANSCEKQMIVPSLASSFTLQLPGMPLCRTIHITRTLYRSANSLYYTLEVQYFATEHLTAIQLSEVIEKSMSLTVYPAVRITEISA